MCISLSKLWVIISIVLPSCSRPTRPAAVSVYVFIFHLKFMLTTALVEAWLGQIRVMENKMTTFINKCCPFLSFFLVICRVGLLRTGHCFTMCGTESCLISNYFQPFLKKNKRARSDRAGRGQALYLCNELGWPPLGTAPSNLSTLQTVSR